MGCKGYTEDGWCIYQEMDNCEKCTYYHMEKQKQMKEKQK